jgi:FMN-dependent NADH-azoreductase
MKKLLHLDASPRGARSRSGQIGKHLLDALSAAYPEMGVETLNLFEADLPDFDRATVEGRYGLLVGNPVPENQQSAWLRLQQVATHFLSFDTWLFTVPMWNFGIPYVLKQYIDCVTHPGMTFRNDMSGNVEGLAAGRRAIIVAASAMPFGKVPAIDHLDFQLPYLKAWLGFIGVTDIHTVRVAGTFGPDDVVSAAMEKAMRDADALAAHLAARV